MKLNRTAVSLFSIGFLGLVSLTGCTSPKPTAEAPAEAPAMSPSAMSPSAMSPSAMSPGAMSPGAMSSAAIPTGTAGLTAVVDNTQDCRCGGRL